MLLDARNGSRGYVLECGCFDGKWLKILMEKWWDEEWCSEVIKVLCWGLDGLDEFKDRNGGWGMVCHGWRARSQMYSLFSFSDFLILLKMEGRSIYTHSWTCTDICLIRWGGALFAIWSLWRPWSVKRLNEKVATKTIFLAIWQVATMSILCRGRHLYL